MTKTAYDLSRQPFAAEEVEEESRRKVESEMSREERIAKLRGITEKMLSHKSDYALTARALAAAAYKVSFKMSCGGGKILDNEVTFVHNIPFIFRKRSGFNPPIL